MIDVLEQCMSKLTPKQLALLRLRYSEDLASQEMAHQVGSTAGAIRVMLNRIRTKLLECIDRHASNSRAS
jgi:RNA polymerase sigma factor (sigma-70 family)